jgi:cell division protein FtsB
MVAGSLMLSALFGERGLLEMLRYESEHERLLGEIASLEEDITELELEVEALESDPLALERIAREELGLGLKGEVLVFLGSDVERDPRRRTAKAATATSH